MSTSTPPASATVPQHTLHGADLSWLHLMLEGALPMGYSLSGDPASGAPAPAVGSLTLGVGDQVDLLDPEGVTLARVTVSDIDGDRIGGAVEERSGFSIVDHTDLRAAPSEVRQLWPDGPVWALWADSPATFAVRESVRAAARAAGAAVAHVVPVPTGYETSQRANAPVRLAVVDTTREDDDRIVVVPWPEVPWDQPWLGLRAQVAAAYGATELVVTQPPTGQADRLAIPVRIVDVPEGQSTISTQALDAWVLEGTPLPEWAAEPSVASELLRVHRPSARTGLTVLLSGLSGSGKSTVARGLAVRLVAKESRSVSLLDGDVVRHHLSKGLGFSRPDRITNVLRIGFVASEITKSGGIAVCCPIAPYDVTRKQVRAMVEEHGAFVLVHVATPLAECERRDRKGLYAKARAGEIPEFTGISDPYEPPTDADVVIDTTGRTVDECVDEVYRTLVGLGVVAP